MNDQHYRVVFHGQEIAGFDRDQVIARMAVMFNATPEKLEPLFNGSQSIVKKGLTRQEAEKIVTILRKAGAQCDLSAEDTVAETETESGDQCPKCSYMVSGPNDPMLTIGECPSCGIIIARYISAEEKPADESDDMSPAEVNHDCSGSVEFSFNESSGLLHFLSLEYHLETDHMLPASADELDTATLSRRGWAGAATFLHWMVMSTFFQLPAAILFVLFAEDMTHAKDAIVGLSGIIGMIVSLVIMPLLWQGHTYGQRAMNIFMISGDSGEIGLSPVQVLMRAPLSLLRFAFGVSLLVPLMNPEGKSIEDMVCGVRQASTEETLSRPWNIAFKPILILFGFLLFMNMVNNSLIALKEEVSWDPGGTYTSPSSETDRSHPVQMRMDTTPHKVRERLHRLRVECYNYMVETGRFPIGDEQILGFLEYAFPQSQVMHTLYAEGRFDIQEVERGLEIGLMEDDVWYVINGEGLIEEYEAW